MKPLISVIIPVYNVEKYFVRCMESVLAQTYENYEVILVDDGSTDSSGMMCDEYADNYSKVKVFHQQNKGQSAARNLGVQKSKGMLIVFVDSDDYITLDHLEYLYMLLDKYSVSLACARLERCGEVVEPVKTTGDEKVLSSEAALLKLCNYDQIRATPCAKLYKKEILLKYPYPEGVIFEDLAFACRHIAEAKQVALGDKVIYYYFVHRGSTINIGAMNEKQLENLTAAEEQRKFIAENYPNIEYAARIKCITDAIGLLARNDLFYNENARVYFNRIRDYIRRYTQKATVMKLPIRFRIELMIIMAGYLPSKIMWRYIRQVVLRCRKIRFFIQSKRQL